MPCIWLSDGTILNIKPGAMKNADFIKTLRNIEKRANATSSPVTAPLTGSEKKFLKEDTERCFKK